ncbi:MAG: ABC transporter permease [Desulfobacteraceae bacterium 4572_89]|nr:MAG: ABC transporter permease [Desulfobacteraceae bacterium 4572_89]
MGNLSIKEHYFKFILYIIVIVLINFVSMTLFFRVDLTKNKIYSLSDASKDAVATLSEPLGIKVFFSKNLPAPHNNTERYLRDLLAEYAARAGKQFNYNFYNVSSEEGDLTKKVDENRDIARDYGIQPVQIRVMENDEIKFKNAYMGLVIIHGDLIEKIGTITSTDGLEYQITTAIQKLNNKVSALIRLEDKINVTMYLSSSLNPIAPLIGLEQLPQLAGKIKDTIGSLNTKNLGIFNFKHVDVKTKEDLESIAKKYDLMAMTWPKISDQNIDAGQGAAGIVMEYKGEVATLPLISTVKLPIIGTTYQMADPMVLEEELVTIMEKMIGINKNIGYLADHGSHILGQDRMAMMQGRPGTGMQVLNQLLTSRYDIKSINLKDGSIPDGLNCLVIAKPTEPFSDYELFQIDQALMKGTNIAFFSDAFKEIMPQGGMGMPPRFEPIDTGLEKLLAHYGVKIGQAYVLDKSAYKHQVGQAQGGGEQTIYFAPMVKEDTINNTPGFMNNIKGLVAMQISPLSLVKENIDTTRVTATRLLSSSDQAWLMEGMINLNPMYITPPSSPEELSSHDLAYILEGSFTSYFKGKDIPEKPMGEKDIDAETDNSTDKKDKGEKTKSGQETGQADNQIPKGLVAQNRILESSRPAKIFVLGCSQMLQDNMLDPQGRSTNATFILNIIDHLNGQDKIASMRSKQQTLNPLAVTTPFSRGLIKTFNIAILPVLVILFGLGILIQRNAKKKKISKLFNV